MAIIGGERPSTVHATLANMQDADDKGAIQILTADLEARCAAALLASHCMRSISQLTTHSCHALSSC